MKLLRVLIAMLFVLVASYGLACEGPECENYTAVDLETGVYTPTLNYWQYSHNPNGEDYANNYGWAGHAYDIEAKGTEFAYANGDGESTMIGFGGAFQKEIKKGELSGSGALTLSISEASGMALGVDSPECNTGLDQAKVDLEVFGYAAQQNGSFSDDRSSGIGASNWSEVNYWGQTDSYDNGSNDWGYWDYEWKYSRWRGWYKDWYFVHVPDLDAFASDSIFGIGIAGGGTLVYAKELDNFAVVKGITGSFSTALLCGAEHQEVFVAGGGGIGGVAQLPGVGYASFSAEYLYSGWNFGYGYAGGNATVNTTQTGNTTSVTSHAEAFAGSHSGGGFIIFDQPQ